jgi:tripartite motif-containing protein 71
LWLPIAATSAFSASSGRPLAIYRTPGIKPENLALNRKGDIYVSDYDFSLKVTKYSATGRYLGSSPGGLDPQGIAVDGAGNVLVSTGHKKILELGPNLRLKRVLVPDNGLLGDPTGLALDRAGNVYVADLTNDRLDKFSPAGKLLAHWHARGPSALAVDHNGNVLVSSYPYNSPTLLQLLSPQGTLLQSWKEGSAPGQFRDVKGIAIGPSGGVIVADTGNDRLQRGVVK